MKQKNVFQVVTSWAIQAVLFLVIAFSVLQPHTVLAQKTYDTNASGQVKDQAKATGIVQCGNKESDPCTVEDIFNVFVIMTNLLIGMAGIVAIISIIYAGFTMVRAAGSQDAITEGKKRLTAAVIGLVLVFLSFMIINTILGKTLGIGVFGGSELLGNPCAYVNEGQSCPENGN